VAAFAADGSLLWARRGVDGTPPGLQYAMDVAVGADDTALVVGSTTSELVFGGGEDGETTIPGPLAPFGEELFAAALAPDGDLRWAATAQCANEIDAIHVWSRGRAALPSADGAFLIAGAFFGACTFLGEVELRSAYSEYSGDGDLFLAKLEPNGSLAWIRRDGGPGEESGNRLAASPDGAVVLVGRHGRDALFGEGEPSETVLAEGGALGAMGFFVAKYAL
jgi:hypothetical protein